MGVTSGKDWALAPDETKTTLIEGLIFLFFWKMTSQENQELAMIYQDTL